MKGDKKNRHERKKRVRILYSCFILLLLQCLSAGRLYDEMYKDPLEDVFGDEHDLEGLSQLLLYHMLSGTSIIFIMFNN